MTEFQNIVNRWLSMLGPELMLDQEGACAFSDESGLDITIYVTPESHQYVIYCALMTVHEATLDLLKMALQANLHLSDTKGGALAFDGKANALVYGFTGDIENTEFQVFSNILFNFLDTAETLRLRLHRVDGAGAGAAPDGTPQPAPGVTSVLGRTAADDLGDDDYYAGKGYGGFNTDTRDDLDTVDDGFAWADEPATATRHHNDAGATGCGAEPADTGAVRIDHHQTYSRQNGQPAAFEEPLPVASAAHWRQQMRSFAGLTYGDQAGRALDAEDAMMACFLRV